jgi:hypothetical protein
MSRLELVHSADWNAESKFTFHNQMGGAGNCIELKVEHREKNSGSLVLDEPIPLTVSLLYADSLSEVPDQGILTVSEACRTQVKQENKVWFQRGAHCVTSNEGTCVIKVRVEEVSSRHGNKSFVFRVSAADKATGDDDPSFSSSVIDSAVSPPVLVCSKLPTGRGRKRTASTTATTTTKNHVVRIRNSLSTRSGDAARKRPYLGSESGSGGGGGMSSWIPDGDNNAEDDETVTNAALQFPPVTSSSSIPRTLPPLPSSSSAASSAASSSASFSSASFSPASSVRLSYPSPAAALALRTVLTWVESSLEVMAQARWQSAGHEPLRREAAASSRIDGGSLDGGGGGGLPTEQEQEQQQQQPDPSFPVHTILRDPTAQLNAQLSNYRSSVQGALEVLVTSLGPHAVVVDDDEGDDDGQKYDGQDAAAQQQRGQRQQQDAEAPLTRTGAGTSIDAAEEESDAAVVVATPFTTFPSPQEASLNSIETSNVVVVGTLLEKGLGNGDGEAELPAQPPFLFRNGSSGGAALDQLIASNLGEEEEEGGCCFQSGVGNNGITLPLPSPDCLELLSLTAVTSKSTM